MSRRDQLYMTGDEVAQALGIDLAGVIALCEARELPSVGSGDELRVPRAALEHYVEQQQNT